MAVSTAVGNSARARVVGIQTQFKNLRAGQVLFLPQRIAVIGQGSTASTYSTTKAQVTSAIDVANTYGFGSPLHLAVLQLFPKNGDGVGAIPVTVYPLDDDGSGVASAGDITPVGVPTKAGSFTVKIGNIESEAFVLAVGDTVAAMVTAITTAINAVLAEPMLAVDSTTKVDVTAKWAGTSTNDLVIEVVGPTDTGTTFTLTQPVGGLVNPDVDDALNQVGDVWESLIVNCMESSDTGSLTKFATFGEGRWGALVRKPLVVFAGENAAVVATSNTVPDARPTDRTNSQLVAPGSNDLPFVTAARQVARIAVVADNNPPRDYAGQAATGLNPGLDSEQWTFPERDLALKAGNSSIEVKDGVINLSDTITMYHPSGESDPPYRYVVDIVKLQTIIFNLDLIFTADEWKGAPLIPDNQPTVNSAAKKPKNAISAVSAMIDSLGLNAIISDPETAKGTILAVINDQNPKRLDVALTVQLSGNTNIISVDLNFGFFFGVPPIVA